THTLGLLRTVTLAVIATVILSSVEVNGGVGVGTNSWVTTVNGLWGDTPNWSLFTPPDVTQLATVITNASSKTATINAATLAGNLLISNLTVRGFGAGINTLQLTNAPASTLRIIN